MTDAEISQLVLKLHFRKEIGIVLQIRYLH